MSETNQIKWLWDEIRRLQEVAYGINHLIKSGANDEALARVEQKIGFRLPDQLRAGYAASAGCSVGTLWSGFNVQPFDYLTEGIESSNIEINAYLKNAIVTPATNLALDKAALQKGIFGQSKIPFASYGGSDQSFCVDLMPSSDGVSGQILCVDYMTCVVSVFAKNYVHFLERMVEILRTSLELSRKFPDDEAKAEKQYRAYLKTVFPRRPKLDLPVKDAKAVSQNQMGDAWANLWSKSVAAWLAVDREQAPWGKGANAKALDNLENTLGFELPQQLRLGLSVHDGADNVMRDFDFLSVTQIVREYDAFDELYLDEDVRFIGPTKVAQQATDRVPFARTPEGDVYCIDNLPGPNGTVGQIVCYRFELGEVEVIADSYLSFLVACLTHSPIYE
jgi:cell wall assembly regulator SMI1